MQPLPNNSNAKRVPNNPLLSVAAAGYPFDNISVNTLLVPVTPATPAVLQDEPAPVTEVKSFLNKLQSPELPSSQQSNNSPQSISSSTVAPNLPSPSSQQQVSQQPQKQSYFSSILSSLPNLSLSTITGEDSRSQQQKPQQKIQQQQQQSQQQQQQQSQQQQQQQQQQYSGSTIYGAAQGYGASGSHGAPPNPYEYQIGLNQQQSVSDFNAGISAPPNLQQPLQQRQQPPQPPPAALPSSGGAGSYRLGNQRRLKYAPPPDLASNPTKQQYQAPLLPSFPSQPNLSSAPPTFFNLNVHSSVSSNPRLDSQSSPSAPILSGTPSSQGSSLYSSFRGSPVATPTSVHSINSPSSNYNFSGSSVSQHSNIFASTPQAIPQRFPEPATPQNTPADVAFSGFNVYRQQQQQQTVQGVSAGLNNVFGFNEPSKTLVQTDTQIESIKENTASSDKTFTPISAAKVTEKLENLIAEQNDDTLSVKSELSAEVATITAKIPSTEKNEEPIEELTEIDLNPSTDSDTLTHTIDAKFKISSETAPPSNLQEQTLDFFTVPSATSFFTCPPADNQDKSSVHNSFQSQQSITDPFSFVQSSVTTDSANFINNAANLSGPSVGGNAQILNPSANSALNEHVNKSQSAGNVDLAPQSILGPNQNQGHSAILNPVYGAPVQPTFFNPAQFKSTSHSFQTAPSNVHSPSPIDKLNNSPSAQLPVTSLESINAVQELSRPATLSPVQVSVNPSTSRSPLTTVPPSFQNLASGLPEKQMQYRPVYHHWFYRREVETKTLWIPFSMNDSLKLEEVHNSNEISPETKVATDGGRYDVEILRRQRSPVYWSGPATEVRRCSWFYKGPAESRYTPYEENVTARLEEEYKQACATNNWNRRVDLQNGEYIIFHSATVQVHHLQATTPELVASWRNNSDSEDSAYLQSSTNRPRIVKRGMDEFNIEDGEPEKVDHLLFLVHGIGSVCDLKFRTVEEVVDEFRSISLQLVQSHYRNSSEQGIVNRIEVLPISWHATLHSGIDKKLQVITLESIPKLRHFTNDTLLDILFYTSPIYCETIMQTVGNEMNRLYALFNQRNPDFQGNVYLGGHSLGSLILFDLLCHQKPQEPAEENKNETNKQTGDDEETNNQENVNAIKPLSAPILKRKLSKKISYVMGTAGTGQPFINYPQLAFNPCAFFALGSPIGMFVTVRGIDTLGEDFALPTCPAFFNIFHPFDPVAYRVESLINSDAHKYRPMLIPHHKGRKRMHLELKETMARVGADLKQRLLESVRSTWNSVYQLAMFHKQDNQTLEQEIEKVVEEQMINPPTECLHSTVNDDAGVDLKIGKLNGGRRIDYVLQEAPFEYINEYLFALTSHVCYWESEDTMLMILKEIYGSMGIQTDAQLPQQSLSIERVSTPTISASSSSMSSPVTNFGIDPTVPITTKSVGPPPTSGFVRKS